MARRGPTPDNTLKGVLMMPERLTEAQARKLGYEVIRGAYAGTTDDRADRWYIQEINSDTVDRRGAGFSTKKEALEVLSARANQDK